MPHRDGGKTAGRRRRRKEDKLFGVQRPIHRYGLLKAMKKKRNGKEEGEEEKKKKRKMRMIMMMMMFQYYRQIRRDTPFSRFVSAVCLQC